MKPDREKAPLVLRRTERGLEPRSRLAALPAKSLPGLEKLLGVLSFNSETGVFCWKISRGTKAAGAPAGHVDKRGYIRIGIDGQLYAGHRIAWLMHYGEAPPDHLDVDHLNLDKSDNRIANLRLATRAQNKANSTARSDSKAGIKGVRCRGGRWEARIYAHGRFESIGWFDTAEAASLAYAARAREVFGEFARCNEA